MAEDPADVGQARLALDRERHAIDIELRRAELELKRTVEHRRGWRDPLILAILAASIGLIGNGIVTLVNASTQRSLEDQRDEAARILQSLSIADREQVKKNLQFLVDAGLVVRNAPRLTAYLRTQGLGEGPSIAAAGSVASASGPTFMALALVPEDDEAPRAADVAAAMGPFCAQAVATGELAACNFATLAACQTGLDAEHRCGARPAKVSCFGATSTSGLAIKKCSDTAEHCEALRQDFRRQPKTLAALGRVCVDYAL
ncbi:MAG: hypothetical protein ABI678_02045 [Kofleriaceae bacterium]